MSAQSPRRDAKENDYLLGRKRYDSGSMSDLEDDSNMNEYDKKNKQQSGSQEWKGAIGSKFFSMYMYHYLWKK